MTGLINQDISILLDGLQGVLHFCLLGTDSDGINTESQVYADSPMARPPPRTPADAPASASDGSGSGIPSTPSSGSSSSSSANGAGPTTPVAPAILSPLSNLSPVDPLHLDEHGNPVHAVVDSPRKG